MRGQRPNWEISIHALLAESDTFMTLRHCTTYLFLSTLSLRRATTFVLIVGKQSRDFYPRSPCGERHIHAPSHSLYPNFYPRSPCGERHASKDVIKTASNFYPRSPCGERRLAPNPKTKATEFLSTLSLRRATLRLMYFWPSGRLFLSTLSLRRATRERESQH